MFTVLFSDTSYNRLGVRLFSYPPSKPRGEGSRERPRNREPKKQEYRTEAVLIADLGVVIDKAISWTELLKNLEQANAFALKEWKRSLNEVKQEADKLLKGLENLELPDDLKADAQALLAKARHLSRILPKNVQAILNSRVQALEKSQTDLNSRVQALEKSQTDLKSRVQAFFKKSQTGLKQEDLNELLNELQILLSLKEKLLSLKEELPSLIEELPGKLGQVDGLLSKKLRKKK